MRGSQPPFGRTGSRCLASVAIDGSFGCTEALIGGSLVASVEGPKIPSPKAVGATGLVAWVNKHNHDKLLVITKRGMIQHSRKRCVLMPVV
eukprot:COSAG06_NODE_5619_length_3356_cov_3.849555_1_plen_91_part_00